MKYNEKDLKPIKNYLNNQDHGIKKKLAEYVGVTPQQVSFYFKYKNVPVAKFMLMKEFVKRKITVESARIK